jgi:polysaccharide biosynthesis PFTS motif protein
MSAVSLTAFLTEGSARSGLAPFDIVVQGAAPVAGAPFVHRPHHPAWRTAPSFAAKALLILDQLRALGNCLLRGGDWRFTEVLSPILLELPALKAWFRHDPPAAVLYTNHVIGGEPAAALVGGAHGVRTMMVLYSTNYRYHVPPARTATEPATVLFPEARHVAADMVAMWSEEMAALYRSAGYPAERLPVVGPVHFAHEGEVRPTSRFAVGRRTGPVRIGVFDVSTQEPARLFSFGFGQTMYFRDLADRFFADLASACREVFGDDFVLVRKLKRALATGLHMPDVQLDSLLGADKRRELDPDANLWRVLEDVDLVICMPFTSVALMADQIGVPSAFFDPLSLSERSEASGRIPHLLGKSELIAWMRAPHVPKSTRRKDGAAAQVMRLALGGRHVGPATAREAAE